MPKFKLFKFLPKKEKDLNDALTALKQANLIVSQLKVNASAAMKDLGQAKFNLKIAQNKLYVAQAAKQQADKAIFIVNAQTIWSILKATSKTAVLIC